MCFYYQSKKESVNNPVPTESLKVYSPVGSNTFPPYFTFLFHFFDVYPLLIPFKTSNRIQIRIVVYYESIKREPKIRGISECRCDEDYKLKVRNLHASHTLVGLELDEAQGATKEKKKP